MLGWFGLSGNNKNFRKGLPLLNYTAELLGDLDFTDTLFVGCIHLLKANYFLIQKLIECGLRPGDIYLLGKVYSTSHQSASDISQLGVYIHPASEIFDSHKSFDEAHLNAISELIAEIKPKIEDGNYKKLIVVDDGGHLLDQVLKESFGSVSIKAVEWTSSGYNLLKDKAITFPIINMARSKAKLTLESPMIADAAIRWLKKYFGFLGNRVKKILVIGGGAIGSSIAAGLKNEHDVQVYDLVADSSDFYKERLTHILGDYDMVIGATGKPVLVADDYHFLKKGAILASISSSDREFSAVGLRRKVKLTNDSHKTIAVDNVILLNAGFPITFDGSEVPVALEKIQLTIALAFASIAQALTAEGNGFADLAAGTQQKIIDRYLELLS